MTTSDMRPGEHDFVTDLLGGVVAGLTLGLVDLSPDVPDAGGAPGDRRGPRLVEDRERE